MPAIEDSVLRYATFALFDAINPGWAIGKMVLPNAYMITPHQHHRG